MESGHPSSSLPSSGSGSQSEVSSPSAPGSVVSGQGTIQSVKAPSAQICSSPSSPSFAALPWDTEDIWRVTVIAVRGGVLIADRVWRWTCEDVNTDKTCSTIQIFLKFAASLNTNPKAPLSIEKICLGDNNRSSLRGAGSKRIYMNFIINHGMCVAIFNTSPRGGRIRRIGLKIIDAMKELNPDEMARLCSLEPAEGTTRPSFSNMTLAHKVIDEIIAFR